MATNARYRESLESPRLSLLPEYCYPSHPIAPQPSCLPAVSSFTIYRMAIYSRNPPSGGMILLPVDFALYPIVVF
jgi:hypothetical protein